MLRNPMREQEEEVKGDRRGCKMVDIVSRRGFMEEKEVVMN